MEIVSPLHEELIKVCRHLDLDQIANYEYEAEKLATIFVEANWRWLPGLYMTGAEWQKKFLEALDKERFLMGFDKDIAVRVAERIK